MSHPAPHRTPSLDPALVVHGLTVRGDALPGAEARPVLLDRVDWRVERGEHWVVVGPNGAGKTTLLRAVSGAIAPEGGTIGLLGGRLGDIGLRDPRLRVAVVEGRPRTFSAQLRARDVMLVREAGPIALLGARIEEEDVARAEGLLELFGCDHLRDARFRDCSQGERQRIMLARALLRDPELLLLDEPTTGLDLAGREGLLNALGTLAAERPAVTTITVTHHVEEIPASATHALLLRAGRVLASDRIEQALTAERMSACFGLPVDVTHVDGRWLARAAPRRTGSGW
ncbi:MAG: iron complex transport system ATP-binding protein [Baekduia sp.]|jgi:iron complex transport system ATP-binding protein|nr:iron complex transport system ATP-binding protein [Baekduia sp.]